MGHLITTGIRGHWWDSETVILQNPGLVQQPIINEKKSGSIKNDRGYHFMKKTEFARIIRSLELDHNYDQYWI
jgi:hypothetical protein